MFANDFWIEAFLRALTGGSDLHRPMSTENLVAQAEAIADRALTVARERGMLEEPLVETDFTKVAETVDYGDK